MKKQLKIIELKIIEIVAKIFGYKVSGASGSPYCDEIVLTRWKKNH